MSKLNGIKDTLLRMTEFSGREVYKYMLDDLIEVEKELEALKQEDAKLREALEFYADIDSWHHLTTESIKYHKIDPSDIGDGDFLKGETDDSGVGGKRAREALKQTKEN